MPEDQRTRPPLTLVDGAAAVSSAPRWFCGYCAAPAPGRLAPAPAWRVCGSCGLGLLLETREDAIPTDQDPFLIIDAALLVQAMSRAAQCLFSVTEDSAVDRPVSELLAADSSTQRAPSLAAAIFAATSDAEEPCSAFVRADNAFGVRMRARIAPCGPPRAALVVLEQPHTRRLRAVG